MIHERKNNFVWIFIIKINARFVNLPVNKDAKFGEANENRNGCVEENKAFYFY